MLIADNVINEVRESTRVVLNNRKLPLVSLI